MGKKKEIICQALVIVHMLYIPLQMVGTRVLMILEQWRRRRGSELAKSREVCLEALRNTQK